MPMTDSSAARTSTARTSTAGPSAADGPTPPARTPSPGTIARYQVPRASKSSLAAATTFGPLLASIIAIALVPLPWSLLLVPVAAAFLVRTFILMHDCCHGSLFRSHRANDSIGFVAGVLTATPFMQWRRDHAIHHATSGCLDARGVGDIRTLTVREYLDSGRWSRFAYRCYRNPFVLLGVGPVWLLLKQRWRTKETAGRRERASVHATNIGLLAMLTGLVFLLGPLKFLVVYLPAVELATAAGIWLFYVQHQFEGAYWERRDAWNFGSAAIAGSSYLRLPRVLDWITGSIAFHHVHHLSPRIPHYNLRRSHDENPALGPVHVMTLRESLRTFSLKLWDEDARAMIGWR
jgi:acyl-lipid omega-6 desaturase (Delta-12 desaturase)